MNPTPAARDDFQPGPFGLWALGLAGATRSRFREEFATDRVGEEGVTADDDTGPLAKAGDLAEHRRDS